MTFRWIPEQAILTIHGMLLDEHGGLRGTVDKNLLDSTLARPQQYSVYSEAVADVFIFGAVYAHGLAKNHCFSDGNKRIALASIDVFLQLNGHELTASELDATSTILDLAAGEINEEQLAEWIRGNSQAFSS